MIKTVKKMQCHIMIQDRSSSRIYLRDQFLIKLVFVTTSACAFNMSSMLLQLITSLAILDTTENISATILQIGAFLAIRTIASTTRFDADVTVFSTVLTFVEHAHKTEWFFVSTT